MKKKMRRNLFAVLAVLLTAVILFGTTASAYADVNGFRLYRGTFRYTGHEDTFYYSDGYFSISGCEKNEHLRTMSAAMAFSVFGTAPQDTLDLMTDIGMEPDSVVMEDIVWGTPDTIGTVIAKKGSGVSETFTVRRVSYGVGVERVFPIHSPNVEKVELVRKGRVRRSKLYYLRDRVGKAAKVKEKL